MGSVHQIKNASVLLSVLLVLLLGDIIKNDDKATTAFAFVPSLPSSNRKTTTTVTSKTSLNVDGQGMAGGSRHLLGDILRSLQPKYLQQVADAVQSNIKGMDEVDVVNFCNSLEANSSIESWEQLSSKVNSSSKTQQQQEKASMKATTRLFGEKEPIVTLYRDSAAWCPYCQKVILALEEKKVPYEVVKIDMRCYGKDKPMEFLKIQPNGNLPCAIVNNDNAADDGRQEVGQQRQVIGESNDIMDVLDELAKRNNNKTPLLRPPGQEERIQELCDNGRNSLERRLYTQWMWWLTGVRRPEEYKMIFLEHWQEMEDALAVTGSSGPYFLGKDLSLVDLRFIPFVERQLASLAYYKGATYLRDATRYPNIARWLQAMESRPSYQATKSCYYTHSRALPPQLAAGCASEPGCEEMQEAIDSYPIGNGNSNWVEPGWDWITNPSQEAAEAVIKGGTNAVAFAARGAGIAGIPAASAPLADPAATPNEDIIPALDLILRIIATTLHNKSQNNNNWFTNGASSNNDMSALTAAASLLDGRSTQSIIDCLDYLRARIGVPRDMSYPAAQALRMELLQLKELLLQVGGDSSKPEEEGETMQSTFDIEQIAQ